MGAGACMEANTLLLSGLASGALRPRLTEPIGGSAAEGPAPPSGGSTAEGPAPPSGGSAADGPAPNSGDLRARLIDPIGGSAAEGPAPPSGSSAAEAPAPASGDLRPRFTDGNCISAPPPPVARRPEPPPPCEHDGPAPPALQGVNSPRRSTWSRLIFSRLGGRQPTRRPREQGPSTQLAS
ncbi:MAG: hypothetical protein J3K34DRAFT_408173 [Monoraphidium minutum]|nr:MAG: hypothetical protein J3K34DRAFT_408173 [Monoraphidium minutum]